MKERRGIKRNRKINGEKGRDAKEKINGRGTICVGIS
jgi:hypothetical protein